MRAGPDVVVTVDGPVAEVHAVRRPGRTAERFVVPDPAGPVGALREALRRARALRPGRATALLVLLEPPRVSARVIDPTPDGPDGAAGSEVAATAADQLGAVPGIRPLVVRTVAGPGDHQGRRSILVLTLERVFVVDVAEALARRRVPGPCRVDLGPLHRLRGLMQGMEPRRAAGVGVVVDVRRSATVISEVVGGTLRSARWTPPITPESLGRLITSPLARARASAHQGDGRPWLVVDAPSDARHRLVRACAEALPAGAVVDLAVERSPAGRRWWR